MSDRWMLTPTLRGAASLVLALFKRTRYIPHLPSHSHKIKAKRRAAHRARTKRGASGRAGKHGPSNYWGNGSCVFI